MAESTEAVVGLSILYCELSAGRFNYRESVGAFRYTRCEPQASRPCTSGKTNRHRLNRGGDRHANSALYRIVIVRLGHDPRTREYMRRRTTEGLSKTEIIRCLKRYVAHEVFWVIHGPADGVRRAA